MVENIDETNLPLPFVKSFGLTSGTSVRGTVGLILVRNVFNCFNFYSIDLLEVHLSCTFRGEGILITRFYICTIVFILFVLINKFKLCANQLLTIYCKIFYEMVYRTGARKTPKKILHLKFSDFYTNNMTCGLKNVKINYSQ